jgi:hypothetical protein
VDPALTTRIGDVPVIGAIGHPLEEVLSDGTTVLVRPIEPADSGCIRIL